MKSMKTKGIALLVAPAFLIAGWSISWAQPIVDVLEELEAPPALGLAVAVPNSFIVTVAEGEDPRGVARAVAAVTGGEIGHVYTHALQGFSITLPRGLAIAAIVSAHGGVLEVEPNLVARAFTSHPPQTGADRIEADENSIAKIDRIDCDPAKPSESCPDPNPERVDVDIAIIDTGIDLDHLELNVVWGVDCIVKPCSATQVLHESHEPPDTHVGDGDDDGGHGTHVAGIVAALDGGPQVGEFHGLWVDVVGVAPGARLWAVKVLGADGTGSFADVIAGVDYVTDHAADIEVANMSLGAIAFSPALRTAIANSVAKGVVYVVAAGNEFRDIYGKDGVLNTSQPSERFACILFGRNCNSDTVPAAYPEVIAVSAMGDTDGQAGGFGVDTNQGTPDDSFGDFSNFSASVDVNPSTSDAFSGAPVTSMGLAIDLAAPGEDIASTYLSGGYALAYGTSMAAPHVAGAVALEIVGSGGRPTLAELGTEDFSAYVADIRQTLIDAAELNQPQSAWGPTDTNDPDGNPEGLVYAADTGEPPLPGNNPPSVSLTNTTANLAEDTDTSSAIKVADIVVSDDALGTNVLSLSGADAALFEIVGTELRLKAGAALDFEGNPTLDVTVEVDDATVGATPDDTASLAIAITDVNEAPTVADQSFSVDEAAANGSSVGTVAASDPDQGDTLSYAITGGAFAIDGGSGEITVADNSQLASGALFSLTVTVTDNADAPATATATVSITVTSDAGATSVHVGSLVGTSTNQGRTWTAIVTVTVHYNDEGAVQGAIVSGHWNNESVGSAGCTPTNASGQCTVNMANIRKNIGSVTFKVDSVTAGLLPYLSGANHITSTVVNKP